MNNPIIDILTGVTPTVDWLIPNLLTKGSLVQYAGTSGAGKSTFAYSLAMATATQTPFLGFQAVCCAKVLYCDMENSQSDRDEYVRRAWIGMGRPDTNLVAENMWLSHFELGGHDWDAELQSLVHRYDPELVIFDVATACFSIIDENDNSEASRVIQRLRTIQHRASSKPAMIILRHANMANTKEHRKARGAQTWKGSTDATWFHVRHPGRPGKSGLSNTHLEADKTRAWGLREVIQIQPEWIEGKNGLFLRRV